MAVPAIRKPIYQQIRDTIAAEIASNVWQPGTAMPSEADLAARHGVAYATLRQALDALATDGLIERVHGRGTFVRRPTFKTGLVLSIQCLGSAGDQRPLRSRIMEREARAGPKDVTEALRLADDADVVRLLRLCTFEGSPVLSEEIWLPHARFASILTTADPEVEPLYPLYERLCGATVACAEETVTIAPAQATDTKLLGVPGGSSLVLISRLSLGYDDRPIELRLSRGLTSDLRYKIIIR